MIEQLTPKIYNEDKGEWQDCCRLERMPVMTDGLNPGAVIGDEKNWQCCCGLDPMYDMTDWETQHRREINKVVANIVIYMGIKGGTGLGIFFTPRQRWLALNGTRKQRKKWVNAYVRKCIKWRKGIDKPWSV